MYPFMRAFLGFSFTTILCFDWRLAKSKDCMRLGVFGMCVHFFSKYLCGCGSKSCSKSSNIGPTRVFELRFCLDFASLHCPIKTLISFHHRQCQVPTAFGPTSYIIGQSACDLLSTQIVNPRQTSSTPIKERLVMA